MTASFEPLPRSFFERDARVVARALIGTHLIRSSPRGRIVTRIVETEAYRGPADLACHARFGRTARTRALFGPPGHAYVFLIYGMYECFNLTCLAEGKGHAVLVRAVAPVTGLPDGVRTDGPGRLTRALAITRREFDGADVCASGVVKGNGIVVAPRTSARVRIGVSARVGVAYAGAMAEEPWRFFEERSAHVSRPSPRTIGLGVTRARA